MSLNHKKTTLSEREPFHFDEYEKNNFFQFLKQSLKFDGIFILSTCNRTDFYIHSDKSSPINIESLINSIEIFKKKKIDKNKFYIETKVDKITTNLFRTACGIESMVIGEYEIVDQIKKSLKFSIENNHLSPFLNRLIQKSLECSKYIRTNTKINKGSTSISSVLIKNLNNIFGLKSKNILIVGAGKMSKLSIKHLKSKTVNNIFVTNRSSVQLNKLHKLFGIIKVPFKDYIDFIPKMDFVIFLTSSKTPLITDTDIDKIIKKLLKKIIFIDLSVPRNINFIKKYDKLIEFNLDHLKNQIEKNKESRTKEIKKAEKYIDIFQNKFIKWHTKYNYIKKNKYKSKIFLKPTEKN